MDWIQQQLFCDYYRKNPVSSRYTSIKLSMVCNTDQPWKKFPKLKGKAAEVRGLTPALEWLWGRVCNKGDPIHRQVLTLLQCSVKIDELLVDHADEDCWHKTVSNDFKQLVFGYYTLMNSLLTHFGQRPAGKSMHLFNVVIKNHYMAHIALISEYINPRLGWTFMGEDLMQKIRRVAGSCSRGNDLVGIGRKFTSHYVAGLTFVLSKL